MNIFFLSKDPKECAEHHCNKHVVKMLIEYCQLLSIAVWVHDPETAKKLHEEGRIYNAPRVDRNGLMGHKNNPSAVWVRASRQHYEWLLAVSAQLAIEYFDRYGSKHEPQRQHRTYDECLKYLLAIDSSQKIPDNGWTDPPQTMPEQFKDPDTLTAYRKLYREDKIRFAKYTNRDIPHWLIDVYLVKNTPMFNEKK